MHAAAMQSMSAVGALPASEKPKEPSPEWQIVQEVLGHSMNTLGEIVSLALVIDGLISSLLEIRLAIALTRPWDDSAAQWPLVHLIEAGRQKLLEPGEAEWYFYEHGKEKAVAALYQATVDDKQFFDDFDKLLHHSKVSLIGRIQCKVAPYWDRWVRKYEEPRGINISYFKISRRRKTQKTPASQKKRPVKRRNLEPHEDEAPTAHSAISTLKRRRFKSPNEEGNTLIPDPAQLPDKSNTQPLLHPQPPAASVPEDTQCNSQTGPPPSSNDALHSLNFHTLAQQQITQRFTETGRFDTPQPGSRIDEFEFEGPDIQHPPMVPTFQTDHSDGSILFGIDEFSFENLDIGVIQHPPTVPAFQTDHSDGSILFGIDEFNFEGLEVMQNFGWQ